MGGHIATTKRANIWRGELASNIVALSFASSRAAAYSFPCIKVVLKEIRGGCVQRRQELMNQLLKVSGVVVNAPDDFISTTLLAPPPVCPRRSEI